MLGLEDRVDLVTCTAAHFLRHGRHGDYLVLWSLVLLLLHLQRCHGRVVMVLVDRGQYFIAALMLLIAADSANIVDLRKDGLLCNRCIPVAHLLILLIQSIKYALLSLQIDIGRRAI